MIPNLFHFVAIHQIAFEAYSTAGIGFLFFICGIRLFSPSRRGGRNPQIIIGTVTPGPATISGVATGTRTLSAPITGKPCYIYRTTIWQQDAKEKKGWKKAAEETGHLTFVINYRTGRMSVEPLDAELDLRQTFTEEYESRRRRPPSTPVSEAIAAFLARNGIEPEQPTRVEECCLEPDSPLVISGTVWESVKDEVEGKAKRQSDAGGAGRTSDENQPETNPNLAVPVAGPKVIRLASGPIPWSTVHMTQQGKIAAALSRAGMVQKDIWNSSDASPPALRCESVMLTEKEEGLSTSGIESLAAQAAAANGSQPAGAMTGSTSSAAPEFVIGKGRAAESFVISNQRRADAIFAPGWRSVTMVVAGTTLTALGIFILLLHQHLQWIR